MFYKIAWAGLFLLALAGTIYLGTAGITVAKRSVQMEIPAQKLLH